MTRRIFALLLAICLPLSAYGKDQSESPKQQINDTIEKLVNIVEAYPDNSQSQERRSKMREILTPRFDFHEMSKRSLGAQWNECTEEQRKEFVDVFSELLATTYLKRIENVERNMVEIKGQKLRAPKAQVLTIVNHKGDSFPILYKLLDENGSWKVYDVVIENIGLVANYRNEFAGIIRKEKMDGLLKKLREKAAADS